jgi:hypothetical protein
MSRSGSGGVGATLPAVTGSNEEPQLTLEHVPLTEAVDVDLGPSTGVSVCSQTGVFQPVLIEMLL